jgi:DNA polymerase elongation subunit (family B)
MKVRGLACRRRDTPQFIKHFQEEALVELAKAGNLEELKQSREEAAKIYDRYRTELESGNADPRRLIIEQVLSREIEDYSVGTWASLAAQEMIAEASMFIPAKRSAM